MISKEMVKDIIEEAIDVLDDIGIFVENDETSKLLIDSGMKLKDGRICISPEIVEKSLKTVPNAIKMYDRNENIAMRLEDNNVHFNPGSAALKFRDSNGNIKDPDTQDYINLTKLTDFLPNMAATSTAMIPKDVPDKIADIYRFYLSLLHSKKPIVTGTFLKENFEVMKEMLVVVRGSQENLEQKPLAIFDACASQPLKWSDLTCQSLIDSAKYGIPAELISVPLAGATAPVSLKGSLVQHTAENLSGIVISQLIKPGAPLIYGGSPSILDMRNGTTPIGSIETMMLCNGYASIGKYLGLPTHGYLGLSDSKELDYQAGFESAFSTMVAAISGINVVSGPGMLALEDCQSLEKLMADDELCGMAFHFIKGVQDREEIIVKRRGKETRTKISSKEIIRQGIEKDNFVGLKSTRAWFREEQYITKDFINRANIEHWLADKERKSFEDNVRENVKKALESHNPPPLDKDVEKELHKIMDKVKESVIS